MFSGIIEHKAQILTIENGEFSVQNTFSDPLEIGQSIAHDGACMTLTSFDDEKYSFFAMEESFKKTNFGQKKVGDFFNVEQSLKFGGKVDGHFVTGHIDTTGIVEKLERKSDNSLLITLSFDSSFANNIVSKGSIAINGVSLTVVECGEKEFPLLNKEGVRGWASVSLIPLTQDMTNLGDLKISQTVNLEFDMMGKYILQYIEKLH